MTPHERNNAVIEAAKAAAHEHGVILVIGVATLSSQPQSRMTVYTMGVDMGGPANTPDHLAATLAGAITGAVQAKAHNLVNAQIRHGLGIGERQWVRLFDRSDDGDGEPDNG